MPIANYVDNDKEIDRILNQGTYSDDVDVQSMLLNKMSGVEAMPYQFLENVDRRITGTEMGRKYTEKIVSRIPLLFLTPCKPLFMDDFSDSDRQIAIDSILNGGAGNAMNLINGRGRYYSAEFDYATYFNYLNPMLASVAAFLGIYEKKFKINGSLKKIGSIAWQDELNSAFKTFFSASENLVFYLDGLSSVNESYTNETSESSLASQINGFADTANEIRFLFGDKGGLLGSVIDGTEEITTSITSSLSKVIGSLGGGIVQSLSDKGVNTILNGGKIVFPEIWSDSNADRSYSIDIKLRSPDHDSISIFMNVLKPYCKILALCLPRLMEDGEKNYNPNGYRSPFLVKAYCKGLFSIDMGIISSLSVTKGAECCWNDDGLPTQIDISLDIKDLYSSLAMSGDTPTSNVMNNTSYMDFLANMAGLNIGQMEIGRRVRMYYYLTKTDISTFPSRIFTRFDQAISRIMGNLYEIL